MQAVLGIEYVQPCTCLSAQSVHAKPVRREGSVLFGSLTLDLVLGPQLDCVDVQLTQEQGACQLHIQELHGLLRTSTEVHLQNAATGVNGHWEVLSQLTTHPPMLECGGQQQPLDLR